MGRGSGSRSSRKKVRHTLQLGGNKPSCSKLTCSSSTPPTATPLGELAVALSPGARCSCCSQLYAFKQVKSTHEFQCSLTHM